MRIFADECVYRLTTEALRILGHDIVTAQEAGLAGKEDHTLLVFAIRENRVFLTIDLDFSDLRSYPPQDHSGVIVLKISPRIMDQVHAVLRDFLASVSQDELNRTLVILDRNKYRIRR